MIGIIVPHSHMACIHAAAAQRIKEDCVITVITIEDAITHIIALLVLIFFFLLFLKGGSEGRGHVVRVRYYTFFFLTALLGAV